MGYPPRAMSRTSLSEKSRVRRFVSAVAFTGALLCAAPVFAGEIKFGKEALPVDGDGKITDAGTKAAVEEIPSQPGDEEWVVHLWARLDKSGPGALNVEFYGKQPNGEKYLAYRHVENDFEGGKYVNLELELEDGQGFNKNHTYTVEITQLDEKGRDTKLATGKLKLGWTPAPKEPDEKDEEGKDDEDEGEEGEEGDDAQDAQDTLGETPPPVESGKKKGCAIDPAVDASALGVLALFALGFTRRRR
jgi:MYXO-CTERM domain-containing protein